MKTDKEKQERNEERKMDHPAKNTKQENHRDNNNRIRYTYRFFDEFVHSILG